MKLSRRGEFILLQRKYGKNAGFSGRHLLVYFTHAQCVCVPQAIPSRVSRDQLIWLVLHGFHDHIAMAIGIFNLSCPKISTVADQTLVFGMPFFFARIPKSCDSAPPSRRIIMLPLMLRNNANI